MVYSIQVKRLRNEDPLDALILQTTKRKRRDDDSDNEGDNEDTSSAPTDFVFKFAQTYESEQPGNRVLLQGDAPGFGSKETRRKFRSAGTKRMRKEGPDTADSDGSESIPSELRDMLAQYIKPQQQGAVSGKEGNEIDKETEDYVYDVYFSEPAGPVTPSNVGYIELDEKEERLLFEDSGSDAEDPHFGGDEDSNAEDYYRNDYPDEDSNASDTHDSDASLGLDDRLTNLHVGENGWSEEEGDPENYSYERYGWR